MYIDYKATVWFRVPIHNKDKFETIKKLLEKGASIDDLYNDPNIKYEDLGALEAILDTEELMSVEENDGCSTIELFGNAGNNQPKCVFRNGKEECDE